MWKLLRRTLLVAVVMLAAAIAVPFIVPMSHLIPELARIASARLKQPVSIHDLQLHLVPTPKLVATGISIGRRADVTIGELEIVPDLLSFFSGPRTIRIIRAARVEMQPSVLRAGRRLPNGQGGGEPIVLKRVLLEQVVLRHPEWKLPRFDADVDLGEEPGVVQVLLHSREAAMRLQVQASFKGDEVELSSVKGELYGGTIAGSVRASLGSQKELSGKASVAGVDLVPVQQALGKAGNLSGRLKAEGIFALQSDGLVLDVPFEVHGGAYQGVDLSRAGETADQPARGGTTVFEQLTGTLEIRGDAVRLKRLCMRSPGMVAGGSVQIGPGQALSGKLDLSMAKTGGFVGVPMSLGGTTSEPSLTPSKGYVIGAVIGTMLLPGIGTTLGASAGSRLEGVAPGCK
jgi:uncharacterized protein involved in outer membrane biogenesis